MAEGTRRGQDSQNGLGFTTPLKQELSPAARAARAAFLLTPEGKADGRQRQDGGCFAPELSSGQHLARHKAIVNAESPGGKQTPG